MKKPEIDMQSKRMMVDTKTYFEMIDALIEANGILVEYLSMNDAIGEGYVDATEWEIDFFHDCKKQQGKIEQALLDAGCTDD